jgi:putative protease
MLELLAPAGSMEALRAAVQNGANAVYLGCGQFNARQSAKNFTPQTLMEAVKYCHVRGVKVHLTLNTLVSDLEAPAACDLIRQAANCGVDAFIVQDLGIIQLAKQIAPHIPLHGSTQMSIHSLAGVQLCAGWGLSRVVLSRELSREEIVHICRNSPIEIEVFAHGALCMCYSGQCYLSAAIGSRSGNRGRCAQPCRQSYGYGHWQNKYPLSLKDNCLVYHMADLQSIGVASVKLEGRMKRPEYVAAVTGVYRHAIDKGYVRPDMEETLLTAFNRQGFTAGYFEGRLGKDMFGVREETPENKAWLKEMRQSYETAENPLVPVTFRATVLPSSVSLSVTDPEGHVCTLSGPAPETARVTALDRETLVARLSKTGGTPYYCKAVETDIAPGLTLSAATINGMRRDVLNMLTAQRARREEIPTGRAGKFTRFPGSRRPPMVTVQITAREQLTAKLLRLHPAVLYIPLHILSHDPVYFRELAKQQNICAVLPRIIHDGELPGIQVSLRALRDMGIREVLCGNLGQILPARECGLAVRGDFGLNLYNSGAVNTARELELTSACLSFEMTLPQIRDVSKAVPCEIFAYGRLPLMVTENCLIKGRNGQCSCHTPMKLTDKTGADFPVIKDGASCRSVLLNGKKLNLLDRWDDLSALGLWAVRLYFTTESPREVDNVLSTLQSPVPFDPGACTRGLYLRGVD